MGAAACFKVRLRGFRGISVLFWGLQVRPVGSTPRSPAARDPSGILGGRADLGFGYRAFAAESAEARPAVGGLPCLRSELLEG